MARKKSFRPSLKPAETIDELRKGVESELNRLSTQLGSQDFFSDASANTYRLTRLGNPAAEHDAVNLKTMRKAIDEAIASLYARLHRPDLSRAYNYNDEEFSIIPGGFVINGLDMTKSFNFDTDIFGNTVDFTVLAGGIGTDEIAAGAVTTLKLTTQEINLGYGGNDMPVRLRIYDTSNNPIGWIGDDSVNHGGSTDYVGAWFKRLLIGGDGTLGNAGMFADANGNVVAKSLWIYDALGTTGWIGSRQITNPPYDTYYGGWFKELYVGGSWSDAAGPTSSPLYVDNSGDLYITDGTIDVTATSGHTVLIDPGDSWGSMQITNSSNTHHMSLNSGSVLASTTSNLTTGYPISQLSRLGLDVWSGLLTPEGSLKVDSGATQVDLNVGWGFYDRWLKTHVDASSSYTDLRNMDLRVTGTTVLDTARNLSNINNFASTGTFRLGTSTTSGYVLTADASGYGTWQVASGGGGTPGGSTTQVQYNNAGSFAGSSNFAWINGSQKLNITGIGGTVALDCINGYIDSDDGFYTQSTSATAVNCTAGGVTANYIIASDTTTGAMLLRELSGHHSGSNTSYGYLYHYSDGFYGRYYNGVSWAYGALPLLNSGSSNTEIVYNSGGNALDSSSSFYYTSSICYAPAFQAASLFRLGTYAGVNGTFTDNDGNTVRVRGGIITDLTE